MKKCIVVVCIVLATIICVTGCGDRKLKRRVNELEETVQVLENEVYALKTGNTTVLNNNVTDQNIDPVQQENSSNMYIWSHSQSYDDWVKVASSPYANEEYLDIVAEKCALCGYEDLAKIIETNTACTSKVITTLSESCYYGVLKVVAGSNKAGEAALINVARYSIDNDYIDLASLVVIHPMTNETVISALANSKNDKILNIIMDRGVFNEEILIKIAKTCVNYDYNDIALRVLSNPISTYTVYSELTKSSNSTISSTAKQYYNNCLK